MFVNTNFPSSNFAERIVPIKYVILHFTEILFEDALVRLRVTCKNKLHFKPRKERIHHF